jgi:transcriptional regulator with XRE-family HTH domain
MEKTKNKDINFGKRLIALRNKEGISRVAAAKKIGIGISSLQEYENKGIIPTPRIVEKIAESYKSSKKWLIDGEGEPFPGARPEYPEIPEIIKPPCVNEHNHEYKSTDALFSPYQKINIDEAIGKTIRVLSAGTALSVALYMNIQQFAAALDASQELKECKELINGLQSQIDDLKRQVDRLSAPSTAGRQDDGSEKEVI